MIRRKLTFTTCDVITPAGVTLGKCEHIGKISPARLAKVARRRYKYQLATITNYSTREETYEMDEETFIEHAEKVK
jgi:hypothetical protein